MPSVDAPDVQVEVVDEVEIRAEVKRPDVDIGGKLACLGGAEFGGNLDHNLKLNSNNTTDEMKLNIASNLPDICNHEKGDVNITGGVDVNGFDGVDISGGVDVNGVETKGDIGVDVEGNAVEEIDIKPVEISVNFAAMPSATDDPPDTDLFSALTDIGDMEHDEDFAFEVAGPAVDVDVDHDPAVLQQVHESDVCVHAAVDVEPSFDLGDKLAAFHIDSPDVPAHPLEINVAMDVQNSPKLNIKEPKVDVVVKGEVQMEESLPNVDIETKSNPQLDINADMSTGQPNGMANTSGISSNARQGLTLDVKPPDSPDLNASGSVGIPSSTHSASEVSFEMSTKGSKKDKKKMKKKKKNKKEGKKKVDGRLNMSIDLEPDATSTPIKSRDQNGRHMIPLTPESGNVSLDGAIAVHSNLSSPSYPEPQRRPHSVVIAIDFGTTFSGYAYSFSRDPYHIQIMRKWEGGDPGVMNMKTPTTLLLTPEGEFHSFGFTARDFYHDMDHVEALNWLYFDKFKLVLHNNPDLCMTTEIAAANGRKLPAIKVFEHALRFFREHAIEELCDQSTDGTFDPDEIRWVLTVPAIWKQPAKQFMRQAAYLAGIASHAYPEQLLIALEPEAASICIRELRMRELQPEKISQRHIWVRTSMQKMGMDVKVAENIRNGTRYMVVDCGGGTVDITVHEVEDEGGTLKELYKATGGACGSVNIDIAFEKLLVEIFGQEYIDEYKIRRPAGWVDLMIAFEARKRNANPWKNNPLNVSLPFSFIDYYKKYTNGLSTVEEEVVRYDNRDVGWSAQGMLRFTPEGMKELFKPTISEVIKHVEDILNKDDLVGVSYLFLAGGFAQSPILQSEMRKKFNSRLRVVIPCDVGMTILKGAVMFGLDPTSIRVRRSRLTYGVGVLNKFDPQKHPKEKYVMKDTREWCKDVFETFVKVDEAVAIGDKVTRCYTPARPNQKKLVINIYSSTSQQVNFVTEEQVTKCGALRIDVTDSDLPRQRRKLHVSMQYGETEIKVSAVDETTGKCVHATIDFLNK
ncbi:heat shock 70 kDa protein 12A-like isoform X2 [Amphiura filiformis]|uniref:heat shock 70 kDa protein 12A-like isoform X2 n=1 Tax=Amphiura filiformis TaxID=82378 RepID=UPI003B21E13E